VKRFERERRILDHNITLIDKALQQTVFSWYCPNLKSTKSLWKTGCAMMTRPSKQICFESTRHHEVNKAVTDDLQRFDLNPEIRKFRFPGMVGNRRSPVATGDDSDIFSKQGNSLLRFLLVEAAQVTVRSHPEWRSKFFHLAMRRGRKIAKVAMARKLAVHLYWMWREGWDYEQWKKFGSHAGEPGNRHGVR